MVHAQRMGLLGGSNPYHPQTQSQSHMEWETGFHARRNTLKHGGEGDVQETDALDSLGEDKNDPRSVARSTCWTGTHPPTEC